MNGLFLLSIACRSMKNLLFKGPLLRRATKVFYIGGLIGHAQNFFYSRLPSSPQSRKVFKSSICAELEPEYIEVLGFKPSDPSEPRDHERGPFILSYRRD